MERSEELLDMALISEFSYLKINSMSKEEKEILRGSNMNLKHQLIRPSLYFKNTVIGNEHDMEMLSIVRDYDFLDFYNENGIHHRQMVAMRNIKTGKVIFGVRGTEGFRDIMTDAMIGVRRIGDKSAGARVIKGIFAMTSIIFPVTSATIATSALGLAKLSKEFSVKGYMKESEKFIRKVMLEHNVKKEDVAVVGHSLGAIMAQLISARVGVEGHGFNGFSLEKGLLTDVELEHVKKTFTNHSFDKDALSNLATDLVEDQVGKEEWYKSFDEENALSAHSIHAFNKSLIRWVRTNKMLGKELSIDGMVEIMDLHGRREFMQMFIYKLLLKKDGSFIQYKEESSEYFKALDTAEIYEFYDKVIANNDGLEDSRDAIEARRERRKVDLREDKAKKGNNKGKIVNRGKYEV